MTLFWIMAALMIVVTLALVLPPLLKRDNAKVVMRDEINAAVYKDQVAELEADLKNGVLSPEQFEQGRRDLQRNLLEDVSQAGQEKASGQGPNKSGRITAAVVALTVPVFAVGAYLQLGNPTQALSPQANAPSAANMTDAEAVSQQALIEGMVGSLAARLESNPQNGEGWVMLGRSYGVLGRFAEASAAYAQAVSLLDEDPQLLADYAEAIALSDENQQLTGRPTELFEKALELDPDNSKALWLAGMAGFQQENFQAAINYWQRLSESMPEDEESAQTVRELLAEAKARVAETGASP